MKLKAPSRSGVEGTAAREEPQRKGHMEAEGDVEVEGVTIMVVDRTRRRKEPT